jgi:hypothetical protein
MQAGLVACGAVVVSLIAHSVVDRQDLASDKRALLAKQSAIKATLGLEWSPMRDRLEQDILRAAGTYAGDHIEREAANGAFRTQPGLYVRMRVADAESPEKVERAAAAGQKDALVACLLREPNERGLRGELDGGAFAEQPWNLGQAYWATRILLPEWAAGVEEAGDAMRLRVYAAQYDEAMRTEIPVAIEIIKRARFLLLALDEDSADAFPSTDGGENTEAALQLVPHPTRVYLFDTSSGNELLRLRRSSEGRVLQVGERATTDPETRDAMQRQANNCALGHDVEDALRASSDPHGGAHL